MESATRDSSTDSHTCANCQRPSSGLTLRIMYGSAIATDDDFALIGAATRPLFHPHLFTPRRAAPANTIGQPECVYKQSGGKERFYKLQANVFINIILKKFGKTI